MIFRPKLRRAVLTVHVVASVGFLGAVATFLALALAGLFGSDPQTVQAAYLAMEVITWGIVVPLCFASLVTGVVQSLGSPWGLVQHYWVLIKLVITVIATAVLLIHTRPVGQMAKAAAEGVLAEGHLQGARLQLVVAASAAAVALVVTTVLSIYKPPGMTRYGWKRRYQTTSQSPS